MKTGLIAMNINCAGSVYCIRSTRSGLEVHYNYNKMSRSSKKVDQKFIRSTRSALEVPRSGLEVNYFQ